MKIPFDFYLGFDFFDQKFISDILHFFSRDPYLVIYIFFILEAILSRKFEYFNSYPDKGKLKSTPCRRL